MDPNNHNQPYYPNQYIENTWNSVNNNNTEDTFIPSSTPSSIVNTTFQNEQTQYNNGYPISTHNNYPLQQQEQQNYTSPMNMNESTISYFNREEELSDAVSRLDLQNSTFVSSPPINSNRSKLRLSMELQPFISITEPTPIRTVQHQNYLLHSTIPPPLPNLPEIPQQQQSSNINNNSDNNNNIQNTLISPDLNKVDEFIAQHVAQFEDHQQNQSIINSPSLYPLSSHNSPNQDDFLLLQNDNLSTTTSQDIPLDPSLLNLNSSNDPSWLSWTPNRGNSPVQNDFDIYMHSNTSNTSNISYTTDVISSTTQYSTDLLTSNTQYNHNFSLSPTITPKHINDNNNNNIDKNRLHTNGITTRPRRVSEPPRISNPLEFFDPLEPLDSSINFISHDTNSISNNNNNNNQFQNSLLSDIDFNLLASSLSTSSVASASSNNNNNNNKYISVPSSPRQSLRRSNSDRRSSKGTGTFPCQHPNCGKVFTRHYNLTSHMRTHTAERPFACTTCGRKFARQHDRNRHEKLHWGIKPFSCRVCKKAFARMDALNRHLRVENGCGTKTIPDDDDGGDGV